MERFSFSPALAFVPREEFLDRVTVAPLTMPVSADHPLQVAVFRISPGGGIKRHPATTGQILAVVDGSGEVSGEDGSFQHVAIGDAVHWRSGEQHETRSSPGMTAVIIESPGLLPYRTRVPSFVPEE